MCSRRKCVVESGSGSCSKAGSGVPLAIVDLGGDYHDKIDGFLNCLSLNRRAVEFSDIFEAYHGQELADGDENKSCGRLKCCLFFILTRLTHHFSCGVMQAVVLS